MSDDELSGFEDGNASPESATSRTTFANDDERRAHHNELESRRRHSIKMSFDLLREAVPSFDNAAEGSKFSRAEILKRASEYIRAMRKRNHAHQQDIKNLETQNDDLESKIRVIQESAEVADGSSSNANDYDTESSNETDSENSDDDTKIGKRIKTC